MSFLKKGISIVLSVMMVFSFAAACVTASAASSDVSYYVPEDCDFAVVTSCSSLATGAIEIASTYSGYPVVEIGNGAFSNINGITSVTIPASVTKIGNGAFSYCSGLEKVVFKGKDCAFGNYVFRSCIKLSDITLPSELKIIPSQTFHDCKALTEINFPATLTRIAENAFATCTALEKIEIPASVTSIGTNAFIRCNAVKSYDVAEGNTAYKSVDGVLYEANGETLVQFPNGSDAENVTVENGTKEIADGAFAGNRKIKSVTLPDSLEVIDAYAFQYCENLDGVVLSAGIKTLGAEAFGRCTSLKSIKIPASLTQYEYAFYMAGLESVVIEKGATEISRNAFEKCASLTSVSLPSTLKTIGIAAFIDCTALKNIEIPASVETIGVKAFGNIDNLTLAVSKNSAAHTYATENSIDVVFNDNLIGIEITKLPSKLDYNYKDSLNTSGMVVVAKYSDGRQEEIKNYEVSPETFTKTGSHTITVSYEGYTDTFGVSVSYSIIQIIILVFLLGFLWY